MDKLTINKKIFLASGSPRRLEMFQQNGVDVTVQKPDWDEQIPEGLTVEQTVMYLALQKALNVEAQGLPEGSVIVAADTVVYKDEILGKPRDEEDFFRIFEILRNTNHKVLTGVAILEVGTGLRRTFADTTEVFFKDYTKADAAAYLATGEAWDKAGGYAIQGGWGSYIDHIVGDRDNVIGFPWTRFLETYIAMFNTAG